MASSSNKNFRECKFTQISGKISTIDELDYKLLAPKKLLNDKLIQFFLEIMNDKISTAFSVHFFSTFFFTSLQENTFLSTDPSAGDESHPIEIEGMNVKKMGLKYNRVKPFVRKINIFDKDFIIIPINHKAKDDTKNGHWYLSIIYNPGNKEGYHHTRCILILDSGRKSAQQTERHIETCHILRTFLTAEYKIHHGSGPTFDNTNFPQYIPEVMTQENNTDCGIFLLQFVESFFQNPMIDFADLNLCYLFSKSEVNTKRYQLAKMVRTITKTPKHTNINFPNLCFSKNDIPVDTLDVLTASPSYKPPPDNTQSPPDNTQSLPDNTQTPPDNTQSPPISPLVNPQLLSFDMDVNSKPLKQKVIGKYKTENVKIIKRRVPKISTKALHTRLKETSLDLIRNIELQLVRQNVEKQNGSKLAKDEDTMKIKEINLTLKKILQGESESKRHTMFKIEKNRVVPTVEKISTLSYMSNASFHEIAGQGNFENIYLDHCIRKFLQQMVIKQVEREEIDPAIKDILNEDKKTKGNELIKSQLENYVDLVLYPELFLRWMFIYGNCTKREAEVFYMKTGEEQEKESVKKLNKKENERQVLDESVESLYKEIEEHDTFNDQRVGMKITEESNNTITVQAMEKSTFLTDVNCTAEYFIAVNKENRKIKKRSCGNSSLNKEKSNLKKRKKIENLQTEIETRKNYQQEYKQLNKKVRVNLQRGMTDVCDISPFKFFPIFPPKKVSTTEALQLSNNPATFPDTPIFQHGIKDNLKTKEVHSKCSGQIPDIEQKDYTEGKTKTAAIIPQIGNQTVEKKQNSAQLLTRDLIQDILYNVMNVRIETLENLPEIVIEQKDICEGYLKRNCFFGPKGKNKKGKCPKFHPRKKKSNPRPLCEGYLKRNCVFGPKGKNKKGKCPKFHPRKKKFQNDKIKENPKQTELVPEKFCAKEILLPKQVYQDISDPALFTPDQTPLKQHTKIRNPICNGFLNKNCEYGLKGKNKKGRCQDYHPWKHTSYRNGNFKVQHNL